MILKKEDSHIIITPKNSNYSKVLFNSLNETVNSYKENNLILDFSNLIINDQQLMEFKNISEEKIALGTSFVIIKKNANLDILPDEVIIVPTMQEAIDMVEMDEMTRSLDF